MKMLLVYPPQWNPATPYLSVPLLAGQLKAQGYNPDVLDLNVRFYNRILEKEYLASSVDRARKIYDELSLIVEEKYPNAAENFDSYSVEEKTMLLRYKKLNAFLSSDESELNRSDYSCGNTARYAEGEEYISLEEIIQSVDEAVRVMRSPIDFYDPEKLFDAKMIIQEALKIASLPFAPNELIWDNYFANPLLKMDWRNIDLQCKDENVNMFIDFFEETAKSVSAEKYDCICISVPDLSQMISAFTLSRILKKYTDAKICVGGNYITQNKADFMRHPEIFGEYVDFLMTGDGEKEIISLAKALDGEISFEDVGGIVFKKEDGSLYTCENTARFKMSDVSYACFDGYDFSLYFSPHIVMPIGLGKGCYWGKCTFCDYYYGQKCFDIKSVSEAVNELKFYRETYGIKHFMFTDEAVPPKYYDLLSTAIREANLEIYFYSFARLEKGFTKSVLDNMYSAGARMLMWGYECHSPRLMEMMNKGIDTEDRIDIMKRSHDAGIWNNALFIIGYPTETVEEIDNTLNTVKNNRDFINSCTPSNFSLKKNALMMRDKEKHGIISSETNGEFYTVSKDRINGISQNERREIRRKFHADFITENRHSLWPVVYSDFDHVLLYLAKYGLDFVSSYRSDRNICPMFR